VYSVEVGEHIPKEFEDVFINNLVWAAEKGIVLTWAHIGQGGDGHVNCQNRDYIIKKFKDRGFEIDASEVERMKPSAAEFGENLYVFLRV